MGSTFIENELFKRSSDGILSPMRSGDVIKSPSSATIVVAASDSLHPEHADYVCDGSADEVEIQAAIDVLPASGGKALLMEGTYFTTLATNLNNVTKVTLEGINATINSTVDAIIISNGSSHCNIKGLNLDGNDTGSHGITIADSSYCTIENNYIIKFKDDGIVAHDTTYTRIINNTCIDNEVVGSWISSGIEVEDGALDTIVTGNTVTGAGHGISIHAHDGHNAVQRVLVANNVVSTEKAAIDIPQATTPAVEVYDINIIDNTLRSSADDVIFISSPGKRISIYNNQISASASKESLNISPGANIELSDISIAGNSFDNRIQIQMQATSLKNHKINITNNIINYSNDHGIVLYANGAIISNNTIYNCDRSGVFLNSATGYAQNCVITDNIVFNNGQDSGATHRNGITVYNGCDNNIVCNNIVYDDQGAPTQQIGIYLYLDVENCLISENRIYNNAVSPIGEGAASCKIYNNYIDILIDVLAVSATHVRSNEDLSAATPITFTIDAHPDVPRTLSWAFDSHAQITEYDMEVIGTDAKGNTVTETWDETAGWSGETSNAFATITSVKMTSRTGTGAADTMDIGITDVLGLSNMVFATGDVFKIKKNNANATVATAQVNTTYDTYDMSVITLGAGDDFTIWYRSNLNIIS